GEDLDNTTDCYVLPWLDTVQQIQPREVMIYTIDRNTPVATLQKATHQQLDRIAAMVEARGVKCQTSY
ncbi:MAG: radical SAM protein, partial [Bacteroidaceae bacterium]|nr:radical SAM protein [Bacteroidaceae bacterium]